MRHMNTVIHHSMAIANPPIEKDAVIPIYPHIRIDFLPKYDINKYAQAAPIKFIRPIMAELTTGEIENTLFEDYWILTSSHKTPLIPVIYCHVKSPTPIHVALRYSEWHIASFKLTLLTSLDVDSTNCVYCASIKSSKSSVFL